MALMALPNIIRYFRDCYEEDNRRSTLWDIFHASVTHRLFVEREEELLNGFLTEIPLDPDEGLEASKAAYLYQKEKELVYCSLFVVGRIGAGDQEPRAILFHRAGLRIIPLSYALWRTRRDQCLQAIDDALLRDREDDRCGANQR